MFSGIGGDSLISLIPSGVFFFPLVALPPGLLLLVFNLLPKIYLDK